jgi:hypothetical protein
MRSGSIRNCGIAHSALANMENLRFAHFENKAAELRIADLKNMLRCPPLL